MGEVELVTAAQAGDTGAFEELAAAYRHELTAHCYRMLGSIQDAEDAVQESLIRAWRGLTGFEERSSLRTWLYRICTNACLGLTTKRPKRMLTPDYGPSWHELPDQDEVVPGPIWLEPWPGDVPDPTPDPATSYISRESVELAFVAALQHLPATQRAVLLLREVLKYSAAEVAEILDTTSISVNSTLQRARKTIETRVPPISQQAQSAALGEEREHELLDSLVTAWENADVKAMLGLLTEDAKFTMPPLAEWYQGHHDLGRFLGERMFSVGWQVLLTRANGQPAIAGYLEREGRFKLHTVTVVNFQGERINWLAHFLDASIQKYFDLPAELPEKPH